MAEYFDNSVQKFKRKQRRGFCFHNSQEEEPIVLNVYKVPLRSCNYGGDILRIIRISHGIPEPVAYGPSYQTHIVFLNDDLPLSHNHNN